MKLACMTQQVAGYRDGQQEFFRIFKKDQNQKVTHPKTGRR